MVHEIEKRGPLIDGHEIGKRQIMSSTQSGVPGLIINVILSQCTTVSIYRSRESIRNPGGSLGLGALCRQMQISKLVYNNLVGRQKVGPLGPSGTSELRVFLLTILSTVDSRNMLKVFP